MIDILNILLTDSFWAASLRIATPLIFGVLGAISGGPKIKNISNFFLELI